MIDGKTISLILPCKNEERALKETLKFATKEIDEIIVVDNGSTDKTSEVAGKFGAKVFFENQNQNGIGYGFALARGIREASGDIIVCMDGDGSYPVEKIPQLIKYFRRRNIDFVSCNRLPFKDLKKMSSVRILGITLLNWFIYFLFGLKIRDCLSGMWIFRRHILENMELSEGGWNFSLEIKLSVLRNSGIKFAELSIPYHDRIFDTSKQNLIKTGLEHTYFILRKRFAFKNRTAVKYLLLTNR